MKFLFLLSFLCVLNSSASKKLLADQHLNASKNAIIQQKEETGESQIDSIKLIAPPYQKEIDILTPKFVWLPLPFDDAEYRLLVSKSGGKIVLDRWIRNKTSFSVKSKNVFEDLTPYYWMVYGYKNTQFWQSPVWSFWIDQNRVTDIEVADIKILNPKSQWHQGDVIQIKTNVFNRGTRKTDTCFVSLFSGNLNENYFNSYAQHPTALLQQKTVYSIKPDHFKIVQLDAEIPYGYNDLYVYASPSKNVREIFYQNNSKHVIKIQSENRTVTLNGLFLIYTQYLDPDSGLIKIASAELTDISRTIQHLKTFVWNYTRICKIETDRLIIDRLLSDQDFIYQDNEWGFLLPKKEVVKDLNRLNINPGKYDFIFAYYSWMNSPDSWSGYSGYTFKQIDQIAPKVPFSAQPVYQNQTVDKVVTIHEFLHMLKYLFSEQGITDFYSPHQKRQITTFSNDQYYFKWMLETFPTEKWLKLKKVDSAERTTENTKTNQTRLLDQSDTIDLRQNFPNPFNDSTIISYSIPKITDDRTESHVELVIYDLMGNNIRTLVDEFQSPGIYSITWDGRNSLGTRVPSGIYFSFLKVGAFEKVKKLLYIR